MRKIQIEYNKFISPPSNLGNPKKPNSFLHTVEINLDELARQFIIEEFSDYLSGGSVSDYIDLRYLRKSSNFFKFYEGHPGSSKDSRKEKSRVMGQTMLRYFLNHYLDAKFIVNVSTVINKDLGPAFGDFKLVRTKDGDTPDFICAGTSANIFLAEAKGRRSSKTFDDIVFRNARKQFERVRIEKSGKAISLDGYISVFVIANENNRLKTSKMMLEDPSTEGEPFTESSELFDLVKMGHYADFMTKLGYGFVGPHLLNGGKLNESRYGYPVYKLTNGEEYVGIYVSELFGAGHVYAELFYEFMHSQLSSYMKRQAKYFVGIRRDYFIQLFNIAQGDSQRISSIGSDILKSEKGIPGTYGDGTIVCDASLVEYQNISTI